MNASIPQVLPSTRDHEIEACIEGEIRSLEQTLPRDKRLTSSMEKDLRTSFQEAWLPVRL